MPDGIEWVVVGLLVLLLFGGAKLPQLARSLGSAQREFKAGLKDGAADPGDESSDESSSTDQPGPADKT
ncbi:MAG: twin-arginine translocase TatA/TatE family subunit [Microthrixaceae bacterium]